MRNKLLELDFEKFDCHFEPTDEITYQNIFRMVGVTETSVEYCIKIAQARLGTYIDYICNKLDREIETKFYVRQLGMDNSFNYTISIDPSTYNPMSLGSNIHIYRSIYSPKKAE